MPSRCQTESAEVLVNEPRLVNRLAAQELNAIIATAPENVTYLSGFWALPQWIRRGSRTFAVWPASVHGKPSIVTEASILDQVADQAVDAGSVYVYGECHTETLGCDLPNETDRRYAGLLRLPRFKNATDALSACLEQAGLTNGRIGIDESALLPAQWNELGAAFPKIQWIPALDILRDVRAVKTPEEIRRLRTAARIAENSVDAALSVARPGASERELARAFHVRTVLEDASPVLGCIGTGPRSALANVEPSDRLLQDGDVIRFDVGGRYRHYRADIARMAVLGKPGRELCRVHDALREGVRRGLEVLRPGLAVATLFDEIVGTVRRAGLQAYSRHHVGHGIGLDGYDRPLLCADSRDVIEKGMVLCLETPHYEIGRWGLQAEEMVLVGAQGAELMTRSSGELISVAP